MEDLLSERRSPVAGCALGKPSFSHQLSLARQFLTLNNSNCSFALVFHVEHGHTKDVNQARKLSCKNQGPICYVTL